jgi:hypothetical protein
VRPVRGDSLGAEPDSTEVGFSGGVAFAAGAGLGYPFRRPAKGVSANE